MWIDFMDGMVLEENDEVRAVPYSEKITDRSIVECRITGKDKNGVYNALDLETEYTFNGRCVGDPRKIKLTDDMILKVWRD